MKPLLLLVDLQGDFLTSPGLQPPAGHIVHQAARLLNHCRSRGIPVAHIWTSVTRDPDNRMPHWQAAGRWKCEQGTTGHLPPPQLSPLPGEPVFHKTGFSAFVGGGLAGFIESHGPGTVIVAGLHLHACVRETVLGAYDQGRAVWVVEDATGSDDPIHAAAVRRHLAVRAASFLTVTSVIAHIEQDTSPPVPGSPSSTIPLLPLPAAEALRRIPREERITGIQNLAQDLETTAGSLALQMADVIGKPIWYSEAELRRCAQMLRLIVARVIHDRATNHGDPDSVRHRPLGTVAVVTPWNNPFYIPLGKVVPALLYGNSVAWKPSPLTIPLATNLMERIRVHLPHLEAALTMVEGGRAEAEFLINHHAIDAVTLTGSLETGRAAAEVCARRHLPLQAELGGNNASIIWEDADLERAAQAVAEGAFAAAGQRCTANRRIIVAAAVADRFRDHLRRAAHELPTGSPRDPRTRVGPLVTPAHRDRVADLISRATADGHFVDTLHQNLEPPGEWGHSGAWMPPTLVHCQDPTHELVQQEAFGPVLVMQVAQTWEDALTLLNGVSQGLAAALFTRSPHLVESFLERAQAGILKVNQSTADAGLDLPFGGWKSSGMGPPEHGRFDREFFTRPQTVYGDRHPF